MQKPKSTEEAREWLGDLAGYLEKTPYASSRLVFASYAIRGYLGGEQPTLNHAFGLVQPAGRRKRKSKHFELARDVFNERLNGKPWKTICDERSIEDERELRRIVDRCHDDIIDEISNKINEDLIKEGL